MGPVIWSGTFFGSHNVGAFAMTYCLRDGGGMARVSRSRACDESRACWGDQILRGVWGT